MAREDIRNPDAATMLEVAQNECECSDVVAESVDGFHHIIEVRRQLYKNEALVTD